MVNLLVAAILLALLFASTSVWAVSHARRMQHKQPTDDMVKARLWAAAMPLALVVVCTLASIIALFSPGATGLARLLAAMSSTVVLAGLGACATVALYPAYLCARIWNSESGRTVERLHLSLHVGSVYAVIVALLGVRGLAG